MYPRLYRIRFISVQEDVVYAIKLLPSYFTPEQFRYIQPAGELFLFFLPVQPKT